MTTGTGSPPGGGAEEREETSATLVDALLVYAESFAVDAHVLVVGDSESSVARRLLDLGARGVHVFDPDPARAVNAARSAPRGVTIRALVDDLDVRDGAFDLALVPDLAEVNDPAAAIARLRRAVAVNGAMIAMGRATFAGAETVDKPPFGPELGPAALEYAALYDLFAMQFEQVAIAGVVPFSGVVFAELGGDEDEPPPVSVDTRLAEAAAPSVFVIVASQQNEKSDRAAVDPFSIIQVAERPSGTPESTRVLEALAAASQLKADLLGAQLEEARARLASAAGTPNAGERLDRVAVERDGALTRAMELEAVLGASQQTMAALERRLHEAEQGMLERDDRIAVLSAELDERRSSETPFLGVPAATDVVALMGRAERAEAALAAAEILMQGAETVSLGTDIGQLRSRAERAEAALAVAVAELAIRQENVENTVHLNIDVGQLRSRAERAEAALAIHSEDLAHVAEAHGQEAAAYEEQLRDRARVIATLERELLRREQLVKELVESLEELRESSGSGPTFEAAAPLSMPTPSAARRAAEASANEEVALLRGKLDTLAGEVARREGELVARAWRIAELEREGAELARLRDELDALRQALTQEHAARVAAESGEELAHARSELARQAALLEQVRAQARAQPRDEVREDNPENLG
jgi:hypothetical protein